MLVTGQVRGSIFSVRSIRTTNQNGISREITPPWHRAIVHRFWPRLDSVIVAESNTAPVSARIASTRMAVGETLTLTYS